MPSCSVARYSTAAIDLALPCPQVMKPQPYQGCRNMRSIIRISFGLVFWLSAACLQAAPDSMPWANSVEEAQKLAAQQNRLVLLHFWSYDCPPCKKLEQNVFPKPEFGRGVASNYVAVKINAKDNPDLAKRYKVDRWPVDVIITPSGEQLTKPTVSSQDANKYLAMLDQVAATHRVQAHPPTQMAHANIAQPVQRDVMPTQYTQPAESSLPPRAPSNDPYANRATTPPSQPANRAWAPSPAQSAPYGGAQPTPRGAADPATAGRTATTGTGPQKGAYDTGAYGGGAYQPRDTAERRSSYRPDLPVAGAPYVEGTTYRDPRGEQARPAPTANPQPGVDVAMPPLEVSRPVANSSVDAGYGAGNSDPYAPRAPVNVQPEPARRDVRLNDELNAYGGAPPTSQPVASQPRGEAPRGSAQANPYAAEVRREVAPVATPAPANNPPLGLDGFCPVSLTESTKWAKGDVRFGAIHRGRTYLFATAAEQQRFLANPDKYSPMLSGYDPVLYLEQGRMVDGKRQHGIVHEGQMYLFADEATLDRFCKQPHAFTAPVQQAMRQGASGNVRR